MSQSIFGHELEASISDLEKENSLAYDVQYDEDVLHCLLHEHDVLPQLL